MKRGATASTTIVARPTARTGHCVDGTLPRNSQARGRMPLASMRIPNRLPI